MKGVTTTVHLMRHGEVYNPDHIMYGRLPGYHLSDLGRAQAVVAADFLAALGIGYLVASPMQRAQETAAPLAERLGIDVHVDEHLLEATNEFEGRHVSGAMSLLRDPRCWKFFRNPIRPSWGEPYEQIAARMMAAVATARDAVAGTGGEAVCVSHQLPIVIARRSAEGLRLFHDPRKRQCGLTSVTSLTYDGDVVVGVRYVEPAKALPSGSGAGA